MNTTSTENWDRRFLAMAELCAGWSKDPSTKVGAVIVDENKRVVSMGYNGFPKGIPDDNRLNNRTHKYEIVIHAEINAIVFAQRNVEGCTLYTYPILPCSRCASVIIQSGIKRICTLGNTTVHKKDQEGHYSNLHFEYSTELFKQANIIVDILDKQTYNHTTN